MEHPANGPLRGPEDMLALAEHLAARCAPGGHLLAFERLPRWSKNLLWALGGAGAASLWWLAGGL